MLFTRAGQGSMRIAAVVLLSITVSGGGAALAQSEPAGRERAEDSRQQEAPEEVIVRGKRTGRLRAAFEVARQRAYASSTRSTPTTSSTSTAAKNAGPRDRADPSAARSSRTGSRPTPRRRTCRRYWSCQPDSTGFLDTQACLFSRRREVRRPALGRRGSVAAQARTDELKRSAARESGRPVGAGDPRFVRSEPAVRRSGAQAPRQD